MAIPRVIQHIYRSQPTLEGAGVHLNRAFGFNEAPQFDPFLLLDDFRSTEPSHYLKGFPWHPHRGIETITYILEGRVEHGDSLGNKGVIGPGDVQWMTAGSGIIHQEMPQGDATGHMGGFQLWANLPAAQKMMHPRYRDVASQQIPAVTTASGIAVRVISGQVEGTLGPVRDIVTEPEYLDVTVPAGGAFSHPTPAGHTVLAYVIAGRAGFDPAAGAAQTWVANGGLVHFSAGDTVQVCAGEAPARFLLLAGKPIGEPVAWYGPIVMNTPEELEVAFEEYQNGTFLKHQASANSNT